MSFKKPSATSRSFKKLLQVVVLQQPGLQPQLQSRHHHQQEELWQTPFHKGYLPVRCHS
jgi:hypothetical protein